MKVFPNTLKGYLTQISFSKNGDRYEQKYGDYLKDSLPNCERFWQVFVVPLTKRMEGYPDKSISSIDLRNSIRPELEDIANKHYSMFLNLIFAHLLLHTKLEPSLENIYAHLGSACDLTEAVLENLYILLMKCQEKKVQLLQELTQDDFLKIAKDWYGENYSTLYENYKLKGKIPLIKVPSTKGLITEYFGKNSPSRKIYARCSQSIREMRNIVVHNRDVPE